MNTASQFKIFTVTAGLFVLAGIGCHQPVPPGALVLTQSPAINTASPAADILDLLYPPGSRIVLMTAPSGSQRLGVLSEGLASAGDPIISYDGERVFYAGKADKADEWQIYQQDLAGGRPRVLTSMPGGAMNPALLPDGSLVFASPVPKINGTHSGQPSSALYVQSPGAQPRRLTFSSRSIANPTMLSDGRILFVSTVPPKTSDSASGPALFTINNDGTEITAFSGQEDPKVRIERPRELADGRVIYLVTRCESPSPGGAAELVRTARPFLSRAPLFPDVTANIRSVQPAGNGDLLVCAESTAGNQPSLALFRVSSTATNLGAPLLTDPAWNDCEAVEAAPRTPPLGRLSTMDPTKSTGKILCLDANLSSDRPGGTMPAATRVRVLAEMSPGNICALGEVPVQADGSFLAEVPANVPLGFEALDATGRVLRREAPMLWVRPAENRSCIGCHEPRNRSPHNHRPLAVSVPITWLGLKAAGPAPTKSNP